MSGPRRHAEYLWLAPVAAVVAAAFLLARHPEDTRFRREIVNLFEHAERVEVSPAAGSGPVAVISRGEHRRFRLLLHGARDSYVTARCPARPDETVDIYLPPRPPERPARVVRRAYYHTKCGQLTLAESDTIPTGKALRLGPAFRQLVPTPLHQSQCPPEFCQQ